MDTVKLAVLVVVGGLLVYAVTHPDGGDYATAGDDDANIFEDGIEEMKSLLTRWPTGSGPYQGSIEAASAAYSVPVEILAWLLWKESRYNPAVIDGSKRSRVGAMGIAQFMPATAVDELGSVAAALDPASAISGAARYLAKLYRATGYTWTGALAAYNWGVGNVQRKGIDLAPVETVDYYTTILSKANAFGATYV
jgi:soluble lytic murein transglycosylase-like protein